MHWLRYVNGTISFGDTALPAGKLIPTAADAVGWSMTSQASVEERLGSGEPAGPDGVAPVDGASVDGPTITTAVGLGDGLEPGAPVGPLVADDPAHDAPRRTSPTNAATALIRAISDLLRPSIMEPERVGGAPR